MHNLSAVVHFVFLAYTALLFVRIIGSWFPNFQQISLMKFVHFYTEPYLKLFRRVVPRVGMMDLSPLIAFVALRALERLLMVVIR